MSAPKGAEDSMKEVQVLATTPEVCIALSGTIDSGNAEEFGAVKLSGLNAHIRKLFVICALDTIMEIAS